MTSMHVDYDMLAHEPLRFAFYGFRLQLKPVKYKSELFPSRQNTRSIGHFHDARRFRIKCTLTQMTFGSVVVNLFIIASGD